VVTRDAAAVEVRVRALTAPPVNRTNRRGQGVGQPVPLCADAVRFGAFYAHVVDLGAGPCAAAASLPQAAYRKLCLQWHPDKQASDYSS
jgi:hypothetical protein